VTVYCPPLNDSFGLGVQFSAGTSDAARRIEDQVREGLRHYGEPRIEMLRSDIEQMAADADATIRIDVQTIQAAVEFASLLPRSLPAPEVAPDPDGDISFDWLGRSGKIFSVSIDASGRLAYAGRFGEKSKVHGTEQLSEVCPQEIIRGIAKATR